MMAQLSDRLLQELPDDAQLERARYRTDPLADDTVSRIFGPWPQTPEQHARLQQRLAVVTRLFTHWQDNQSLAHWRPEHPDLPPEAIQALADYVRRGQRLPEWVNPTQVEHAQALFMEHGVLSCVLLFCASLPECYVVPDLSSVLQATGQLTDHTEYRVRATAAMVFPVMTEGGLLAPEGSALAQILKVRLIHATVRHLILHGHPQEVLATGSGRVEPGGPTRPDTPMHQALTQLGWDLHREGLPCNQEELAYTLLTFSYVFLRGLRQLGIRLTPLDEDAYLHAWNVVGHVLGVERKLMADSMEEAEELFKRLQTRGRARHIAPDPRPPLAHALIQTMQNVLPGWLLRFFPRLMTRHLCGPVIAKDLGIGARVPWLPAAAFKATLWLVQNLTRLWRPQALDSPLHRLGRDLMAAILLDETRPLQLPSTLRGQVQGVLQQWETRRTRH